MDSDRYRTCDLLNHSNIHSYIQVKHLYIFDFDGTMMDSPLPEPGKLIYEQLYGQPYPHKGWWGRRESLDVNFDIKPIDSVFEVYKSTWESPNSITALVTNRMRKLEDLVLHHLERHQIIFQHYNYVDSLPGKNTKSDRIMRLMTYLEGLSEVSIYDDMDDQIESYVANKSAIEDMGVKVNLFRVTESKEILPV